MPSEGKFGAGEDLRVKPVIEFVDEAPAEDAPSVQDVPEAKPASVTPDMINDWISQLVRWGTPACAALCGLGGVLLAVLLLSVGFWKTLFIAILCVAGVFVGGVKDKAKWTKNTINRLFPPKDEG